MPSSRTLTESPAGLLADMGYGKKDYRWTNNWREEAKNKIQGQHEFSWLCRHYMPHA